MNELSCADFIEYDDDFFSHLMDEMYWDCGIDTELAWEITLKRALKDNIQLIDADTFSYEEYFYNYYKNTEKGLS